MNRLLLSICMLLVITSSVVSQVSDVSLTTSADPSSWKRYTTVSGLPYGLTEKAIDAARKIKFIPAVKDGKFVSVWMQLEYNFNLY